MSEIKCSKLFSKFFLNVVQRITAMNRCRLKNALTFKLKTK